MTLFRVGWPGLIGLVLVLFGFQSLATGIRSGNNPVFADHLQTSSLPNAIGIILLLTAFAIARRTRGGLVLGIVVGALGVATGLALIALEIQYTQAGGEGASYAAVFYVVGGTWSLIWLLYVWRLWKARSGFAVAWAPADRRMALATAAVIAIGTALFAGIGTAPIDAIGHGTDGDAQARALVEATAFDALPIDASVTPGSGRTQPIVNRLAIELDLRSPTAYALAAAPTLCLTSQVVHLDPRFKPGVLCWGLPGADESLKSKFADLTVPQGLTTIKLELGGAGSPCPFSPDVWYAELTFAPVIDPGVGAIGPAPANYTITSRFQVGDDSMVPPPSGTIPASDGCLGVGP